MPFLRPSRLAKLARPVRFTCRCNATRSAQATVSSSSVPPAAAHETLGLVSRPGRLPPSPLLLRQATGEADSASRPDVGEDAPPTIADVALGSRLSEVLQQGRAVGIEDEGRLRELWSDPWSRMMSGPSNICTVTGVRLPRNLFITFRVARRSPDNPGELESMVLVPDGVLHPEWSASIPVDNGVAPPPPMSLVCCDITLERFAGAGNSKFGPRSSNRARLASFPHSIFWPADAPQPPSGSATGVTTVSVSLLQQVEHQLQERILQEAFLLAERVRAADDHSMKLLRVVDEDELDLLRQGQPLRGQNNGASPSKVMAFFDARSTPDDMANFFTDAARNEFISSQLRGGKKEKTAQALSIKDLPSHSTCPLLDGGVPVYALRALLPQEKLDLLIRLFDIIEPTAAGSPTRALQTSASLLGEHGLDPYPLFCAVQRLALFKPETLAWPPAQRRKLWRLVHENRDEDLDAIRKADEADAAARLPLTPDGQIDVRAILGGKKTSARQSRQESE